MIHLDDQHIAIAAELLAQDNKNGISAHMSEHLEQCPHCLERVVDVALLLQKAEAEQLLMIPKEPQKKSRKLSDYYAYFAVASIATLIFSLVVYSDSLFESEKPATKVAAEQKIPFHEQIAKNYTEQSPLTKQENSEKDYAQSAFTPSEIYEPMVGSYLRSVAVEVVAPKVGDTLKGKMVIFEWKNGTQDYTLKLYDNQGIQQIVFKSVETPFQTSLPVSSGLYYWTLESEEELIYTGKIYVIG